MESRKRLPTERDDGSSRRAIDPVARVVVAEDDRLMRTLTARLLRDAGFDVVEAENGRVAIDLIDADHAIGVLVLDLSMPVMSGEETFREVRDRWPDVRVILSSGYPQDRITWSKEVDAFLQKPFRTEDLVERVRQHATRREQSRDEAGSG